ncbi:cupin domain-containing protein [bacterium]|nr:cupin domain-containing protein [bacterium]
MLKHFNQLALLIVLLGCPFTAQAQWMFTDERQLPRDYRVREPIQAVDPKLWDQVPWQQIGPGQRRRVLFNDRLTMVWLEMDPAPQQPVLLTHYHAHDQITMLVEGRAEVRVGDQQRVVEAGAAYVAPSNVHHGLRPLSPRVVIVECFNPTREDFRGSSGPRPAAACTANQVRALVYEWFGLLERGADEQEFLRRMEPRSEPRARLPKGSTEISDLVVQPIEGGYEAIIELHDGSRQIWHVRDWEGFPVIHSMEEIW